MPIEVAGLRHGEVVELLQAELGPLDEAGNAFAERLTRRTGGNPLLMHETLRHLRQTSTGVWDVVPNC